MIKTNNNIYFLRHYRTLNNELAIIGQKDVPILNAEEQFEICQCNNFNNLLVLCSPLTRCVETVKIFIENNQIFPEKTLLCDKLKERSMGELEGMNRKDAALFYPEYFINEKFVYYKTPPNGESFIETCERADYVINLLKKEILNGDILICSHNQFMKVLKFRMLKIPFEKKWYDTKFSYGKIEKIL